MKIVIAPNSFKGSISAVTAAEAIKQGIYRILPDSEVISVPVSDGGDNLVEIASSYTKGDIHEYIVQNPIGNPVKAAMLYSNDNKTAYIEMAKASGLCLIDKNNQNPLKTTTYGTGQLINHALTLKAENIIIGLGGSATCDAGCGMAMALGARFFDRESGEIHPVGGNIANISDIDITQINPRISKIRFTGLFDVTNPLIGEYGAAKVYSPQKGATAEQGQVS